MITMAHPAASLLSFLELSAHSISSTASFRRGGGTESRNSLSRITTVSQPCSLLVSHSISLSSFKQRDMNISKRVNPLSVLH